MKKITFSFPAVIMISLGIQFFGLIRSLLLARDFGAYFTLDAFYLANVFTISIFSIISSAITTIIIPELNSDNDDKIKKKYITSYLTTITGISITLSVVLFIFLALGRNIVAPQFSSEVQVLFVLITLLLLISQQFRIQASFSVAFFQNEGHYIIPRFMDLIPASLPVIYLLFVHKSNIIVLSVITAISYVMETIILNKIQNGVNSNYAPTFSVIFDDKLKEMLKRTVPIFLSSAIFQVQILISNYFAGTFGQGYITLLSNTNQIMGIFQSLFILNLVNMIYPRLVREIRENLGIGLKKMVNYITVTNLIVIILVWGYIAVGHDLVQLLFVRGKFTLSNAEIVYNFSLILGIALPFTVIRDYHYRLYYSLGNTKKPMINSIQTVVFNLITLIIGSFVLHSYIIVVAPALGTLWSCINIVIKARNDKMRTNIWKIVNRYILCNIFGFSMYILITKINFSSTNLILNITVNTLIGAVYVVGILGTCVLLKKKLESSKNSSV